MKQITFFIFSLACTLTVMAQDTNYTGPAKSIVKSFWELSAKLEQSIAAGGSSMDAFKLATLNRKIEDIKSKDPAFNSAAMETKVKTYTEAIAYFRKKNEDAIQDNRNKTSNMQKVDELLRSLFHISTDVDHGDLPTIKAVLDDYKKRTNDMLAADKTTNKKDLEKYIVSLKVDFKTAEHDLYELDRRCREQTEAENAAVQYYEIMYKQAYWDAAQKLYPDVPEFAKAYGTASKLLAGLGNIDQVHAIAGKSKQQKINDTRLPAAGVKDASLEKIFMEAFNKYHGEEFTGTAIKAVITSDDWSIQRNEITGIVTGRIRRGVVVYKGKDGKCYLTANLFLYQEYVGNSFLSAVTSKYPVMGSQEMLCSNVK